MRRRKRRWSTREPARWPNIVALAALGLVAVATAVLVGVAVQPAPPVTTDAEIFTMPSRTPAPPPDKIAFLGDSWAGGTGADPSGPSNGYPGLTAKALGIDWEAFQGGGTGYTQGNAQGEGPFLSRVQAVIDFEPTIVVVQGSSNDLTSDQATVTAAASEVFAQLRAALPNARIYALGAINSPASPLAEMDMVRLAVSEAAIANGVTWIDGNTEGWLDIATDFADGFHPNNQGHAKVAERLAAVIAAG